MNYVYFLGNYFGVYILLLIFLLFNIFYKITNKRLKIIFGFMFLLLLFLSIFEIIDIYLENLDYYNSLRKLSIILNYSLRPILAYLVFILYRRNMQTKKMFLYSIPLIINFLLNLTVLFSGIVVSINNENQIIYGPLAYASSFIAAIYLIAILVFSILKFRNRDKKEGGIGVFIFIISFLSIFIEIKYNVHGLLLVSVTSSMIFYFMNFIANSYVRDSLTDAYLRNMLYEHVKKTNGKTYIIILDINGLKKINDTLGHAEGDNAIIYLSKVVFKYLNNKSIFYRMGGDEFSIIYKTRSLKEINYMVKCIKNDYSSINYGVSIGYASFNNYEEFEPAYILADKMLYKDKREYWNKVNKK